MKLTGYFIAPDNSGQEVLWRENGDYPVAVAYAWDFRHDPDVWAVLVAAAMGQRP